MRITIKEPITKGDLELDAIPEDYNGEQGWRIIFPEKDSFVIVHQNGDWNVMDEPDINPELVADIGRALHSASRFNADDV